MRVLTLLALALLLAPAAGAVIIDSKTGTENTGAPPDDPGWAHVGALGNLTAVYLGNGWVLTARHAGTGPVVLGGTLYPRVNGSTVPIANPDGSLADLHVFRVDPAPDLPPLPIRASTPPPGTPLVLIGNGRDRGARVQWNPPGPGTYKGYERADTHALRWGTNEVSGLPDPLPNPANTMAFFSEFANVGGSEAVAVHGDSGGAVFAQDGGAWELAGVIYLLATHNVQGESQPANYVLYGNLTYAADLSFYRDAILDVILECRNGIDDDGDGHVDWPQDQGCLYADDLSETPFDVSPVSAAPRRTLAALVAAILLASLPLTARRLGRG